MIQSPYLVALYSLQQHIGVNSGIVSVFVLRPRRRWFARLYWLLHYHADKAEGQKCGSRELQAYQSKKIREEEV